MQPMALQLGPIFAYFAVLVLCVGGLAAYICALRLFSTKIFLVRLTDCWVHMTDMDFKLPSGSTPVVLQFVWLVEHCLPVHRLKITL